MSPAWIVFVFAVLTMAAFLWLAVKLDWNDAEPSILFGNHEDADLDLSWPQMAGWLAELAPAKTYAPRHDRTTTRPRSEMPDLDMPIGEPWPPDYCEQIDVCLLDPRCKFIAICTLAEDRYGEDQGLIGVVL